MRCGLDIYRFVRPEEMWNCLVKLLGHWLHPPAQRLYDFDLRYHKALEAQKTLGEDIGIRNDMGVSENRGP